jgi:hypothetical protein
MIVVGSRRRRERFFGGALGVFVLSLALVFCVVSAALFTVQTGALVSAFSLLLLV